MLLHSLNIICRPSRTNEYHMSRYGASCEQRHATRGTVCGKPSCRGAKRCCRVLPVVALRHIEASLMCPLIFLAAVLGQTDDRGDLAAKTEVIDLNVTYNRTFASPESDGPQAPAFSWSSQLCSFGSEGEALVRSDSAGNVLTASGGLICKYAQNGKLQWVRTTTGGDKTPGVAVVTPRIAIGTLISDSFIVFVPGAVGEHILFVATDQGLHAIDVATGSTLWQYRKCGPVHSTPLVVETAWCKGPDLNSTVPLRPCSRHMVVFGAEDEKYYALTFNGTLIWTFSLKGTAADGWPLRFAAAFGHNRVFVLSSRGLSGIEVDGTVAWTFSQYHARFRVSSQGNVFTSIKEHINSRGPVYSSGMVAYSSGQAFHVVCAAKGLLLRQLKVLEPGKGEFGTPLVDFTTAPAWFGTQLFIGDSNSTLYSITLNGVVTKPTILWRYHMPQVSGLTPSTSAAQRKLLADNFVFPWTGPSLNCTLANCTTNCSLYCNSTNRTNCSLKCNLTNATAHTTTSSTPPPTTPMPATPLQPIWDQPVVGKNGLVYVRGPTGLHVIDAWTGAVIWVYTSQPLDANGKAIPYLSSLGVEAPGGKGFTQVHLENAVLTRGGVCGGHGYAACQRRSWVGQASPLQNQHGVRSGKGCNTSPSNQSNNFLSNQSGCSPEPLLNPWPEEAEGKEGNIKQIQCGGDWRHGQGHLASDGSFVLPCRGTVQRFCCAKCSASVISDAEVYPGGNVSLRLDGALPRKLETGIWCLWRDMRRVRFPDAARNGKDHTFSDSVLIWSEANSSNATGSEEVVICNVPGAEWDFPAMFLPVDVVQRDLAGSLHFCSGGGVSMQMVVPLPPPSYLLHFVLGSMGLFVLLTVQLLRMLKVAYVRQTQYGLLERKFSTIGLGGLKYEHYMRLLKFLKAWHMRHLPRVFNLWRRALRLEQVRRKLWISYECLSR
jgi:outer membrane protein assembly factor BamB